MLQTAAQSHGSNRDLIDGDKKTWGVAGLACRRRGYSDGTQCTMR